MQDVTSSAGRIETWCIETLGTTHKRHIVTSNDLSKELFSNVEDLKFFERKYGEGKNSSGRTTFKLKGT